MVKYEFEWDAPKARSNLAKHGLCFEIALAIFEDPLLIRKPETHHGDRWITMGVVNKQLLVVVHTDAETNDQKSPARTRIRIISARRATPRERRAYRDER